MKKSRKSLKPRNVVFGAIALALCAEKVGAQSRNPAAEQAVRNILNPNEGVANLGQWANIAASKSIHAQMRAGRDIVIRSEMFTAICQVALLIALVMLMFLVASWVVKCSEARFVVPVDPVKLLSPLFLSLLLYQPLGGGFTMQTITIGTSDLFNAFQVHILAGGSAATQVGGSAVVQATKKAQIEQSIRNSQVSCAATLNQDERRTCYNDAYEQVQASLDEFREAQWAKGLSDYSSKVLLAEGKNADQGQNIVSAAGGVVGGAVQNTANAAIDYGTGILAAPVQAGLLLVSAAFGITIGILELLMMMFFPLSIALSFCPLFAGTWIKWFVGMFNIFLSSLFLRMLSTMLAIVTVSGASVSGGLYTVSVAVIALICVIMAIATVISTMTGMANNVINNVGDLRAA